MRGFCKHWYISIIHLLKLHASLQGYNQWPNKSAFICVMAWDRISQNASMGDKTLLRPVMAQREQLLFLKGLGVKMIDLKFICEKWLKCKA